MGDWDASLYARFEDERTRPAIDLLARVGAREPEAVVDLGCGPGNSTELLVQRWPAAEVTGVDLSPAMLAEARERLPSVRFEEADVATWEPSRAPDVLFSNATLHWLSDHARLFGRLVAQLAPGGWLAVQMPDNLREPTHALMHEVALGAGWDEVAAAAARERAPLASFDELWRWLRPACARVELWRTEYVHPVAGPSAIVEWLRSTGLRPYLSRLGPEDARTFEARYREALGLAYPPDAEGTSLLRFPRLFVVAQRA